MPTKRKPRPRSDRLQGRLSLTVPVQIRAADAAEPAKPRTFALVAYTGEPMRIGWYDYPVVVDLDTLDLSAQRVPALFDHCTYHPDYIVGQVEAVAVADGQLTASGRFTVDPAIPPERNYAAQVLAKADAGYQWQASIGGDPKRMDKVEAGATVNVNGRDYPGPVQVARGVVLREISFVVLGGDRRTSAVVARLQGAAMDFETWCLSMGFDSAKLDDVQRANMQQMYGEAYPDEEVTAADDDEEDVAAAVVEDDEEEVPPTNARNRTPAIQARGAGKRRSEAGRIVARRRAEAAEDQRIDDIRRICATHNNPEIEVGTGDQKRRVRLQAHAIAEGWGKNKTELEALRVSRPTGPAVISHGRDKDCTVQALQGAMILRAKGKLDHPAFQSPKAIAMGVPKWLRAGINAEQRQQIMEAAHRYDDMSLVDLCREACRLDGIQASHNRSEMIQAAFSGSSLTNVFTTNVNAILLSTYMESVDTSAAFTQETDVADFKTQERPRVEVGPGLSKLARGAEADHAAYEDNGESYKIARYAKQFQIDEQDIIDDALGALSDIPSKFGMAAARLRPDLVYAILLANPTLAATGRAMFHATEGNLITTAALAAATLRAAIKTQMLFQENGVNLNLIPTGLIVPPALKHLTSELINSAQILIAWGADDETFKERGSNNAIKEDNLSYVSDARLENGVTDPSTGTVYSGSASTWFLYSIMAHLIEVAYLRGTGRAPRVRSGQLDKGKFGMWFDCSLDIGAKALDWRGFVKNTA